MARLLAALLLGALMGAATMAWLSHREPEWAGRYPEEGDDGLPPADPWLREEGWPYRPVVPGLSTADFSRYLSRHPYTCQACRGEWSSALEYREHLPTCPRDRVA